MTEDGEVCIDEALRRHRSMSPPSYTVVENQNGHLTNHLKVFYPNRPDNGLYSEKEHKKREMKGRKPKRSASLNTITWNDEDSCLLKPTLSSSEVGLTSYGTSALFSDDDDDDYFWNKKSVMSIIRMCRPPTSPIEMPLVKDGKSVGQITLIRGNGLYLEEASEKIRSFETIFLVENQDFGPPMVQCPADDVISKKEKKRFRRASSCGAESNLEERRAGRQESCLWKRQESDLSSHSRGEASQSKSCSSIKTFYDDLKTTEGQGLFAYIGMSSKKDALSCLDKWPCVLFHAPPGKGTGEEAPCYMAFRKMEKGKDLILRVTTEKTVNGKELWGVVDKSGNHRMSFHSPCDIARLYALFPEALHF